MVIVRVYCEAGYIVIVNVDCTQKNVNWIIFSRF